MAAAGDAHTLNTIITLTTPSLPLKPYICKDLSVEFAYQIWGIPTVYRPCTGGIYKEMNRTNETQEMKSTPEGKTYTHQTAVGREQTKTYTHHTAT